jgi:hypothetical protein
MKKLLDNIQQVFVGPADQANLSVHVFMHLGSERMGHFDTSDTLAASYPPYVMKIVVEKKTDTQIDKDITDCTSGMVTSLFTELDNRYKAYGGLRDHARNSAGQMYRRMFLAHDMVRTAETELKCNYEYILRARPDFTGSTFDWHSVLAKLKQGQLLVGEPRVKFDLKASAVSHRHRCVVEDQLAIGTPEQMYAYAAVYTDFHDLAKYLPLYRADFRGHTNERTMAAHLHYRGLGDAFTTFPHDLKIDYKLVKGRLPE